jgi:type IV pilus assembly protein PilM
MFPAEQALLDFYPLSETDGKANGLLVAAPIESVQRNVDAVTQAGLRPVRVDLAAFGLVRALARGPFQHGVVGLVDVGAAMTTVVVAQEAQPQMIRILPIGSRGITDHIARSLGIQESLAEQLKIAVALVNPGEGQSQNQAVFQLVAQKCQALVEQVARTLSFYAQQAGCAVSHVVLSGRGGKLDGLGQYVSTALGLPVSFPAVDSTFIFEKAAKTMDGEQRMAYPVGMGLALGAAA